MMLIWPLLVRQPTGGQVGPPFVFLALLPVVIVVVLAEVTEGGLDPRVLAVLGVLSAVNAVLRGLSPGTAGVELVFFLLILAGRVFGAGFGFVLGCTSLFASALLTGGVGPVAAVPDARARHGSGWAPDCCRAGSPAAPRSRCWRRTAWSRPTPSGC